MPPVIARAAALSPARTGRSCDNRGMDATDREILGELMRNGRISFRDLGAAVGLSANAAADRVRRLRRDGIITGFTATVDPGAAGRGLVALIDVRLAASGTNEEFEAATREARAGHRRRPRDRPLRLPAARRVPRHRRARPAAAPPQARGRRVGDRHARRAPQRVHARRVLGSRRSAPRVDRRLLHLLLRRGRRLRREPRARSTGSRCCSGMASSSATSPCARGRRSTSCAPRIPDERIEFRNIWGAYLAGYGFNSVVPARGGDVVRLFLDQDVGAELELPRGRLVVLRRADLRPHDGDPDPAVRVHAGRVPEAAGLLQAARVRPRVLRLAPALRAVRADRAGDRRARRVRAALGARAGVLAARAPGR